MVVPSSYKAITREVSEESRKVRVDLNEVRSRVRYIRQRVSSPFKIEWRNGLWMDFKQESLEIFGH